MPYRTTASRQPGFFDRTQANWVMGVLAMLIGVVHKESLLGILLRQTRREVRSLLESNLEQTLAESTTAAPLCAEPSIRRAA